MLNHFAEILSLGLTAPTIILAGAVIYTWFPSATLAFKKDKKEAQDWFIFGVVIGFIGAVVDNLYWSFPWSFAFLDNPYFHPFVKAGVYFNVIFRQGMGVLAGYCHLRAATASSSTRLKRLNLLLGISALLGACLSIILTIVKIYG